MYMYEVIYIIEMRQAEYLLYINVKRVVIFYKAYYKLID